MGFTNSKTQFQIDSDRVESIMDQALWSDNNEDQAKALELYTQAVELCIKCVSFYLRYLMV